MFAVVGVWERDPEHEDEQEVALERIVAGVAQLPGLVKGYWSDTITDPYRSHTYIVFSDRAAADSFAAYVRGNVENQLRSGVRNVSLEIVSITATT